jgi:hypothetical protein
MYKESGKQYNGIDLLKFIDNTSHFQINEARQLPIIILSNEELVGLSIIFNLAYNVKREYFTGKISIYESETKLRYIQSNLDKMIGKLYGI